MKNKVSPSLLAADFLHLADELERAENSGAAMLHCDVMDGVYVPNISFGFDIIKQIHGCTKLPLDVHMMTQLPGKYIDVLAENGASSITLHSDVMPESELIECLKYIKSLGISAAVSLRPCCGANDLIPFMQYIDMALIMTVEPGFGGQKFMVDMLQKIKDTRDLADRLKPDCEIQVDGGVSKMTIADCASAGANVFVVGTAAFRSPDCDMTSAVGKLIQLADEAVCRK